MNHYLELQGLDSVLLGLPRDHLATASAPKSSVDATGTPTTDLVDERLKIHEYERQRMGQELHDSAGQLLVSLQLSVAHLRVAREALEHDCVIDEISDTVRQIDQEIRSLAFLHYPAELGSRGLCAAVQALARGFESRTGIRTSFKCVGDPSALAESISMALLRVAQEALVNIYRHSHASSAKVVVERSADQLHLIVSDNGVGIAATDAGSNSRGIGLQGMRHRMEMLGGRFRIGSLKGGTRISVTVPLPA
jgi:two-component system NarL family sensor kinase